MFVGTKRFPLEDVLAAVGFRTGDTATVNNLKDAIQYLQECGAFSEVAFSQDVHPEGVQLTLHLTDSAHFIPVLFDNIVWFSDHELVNELHRRVPLFRGELPPAGSRNACHTSF
jgi:outer membrane protein assembly factor BamA